MDLKSMNLLQQRRKNKKCYECSIRVQITAHRFFSSWEQSSRLGACTQIPSETHVRWFFRNMSSCCPPQSVRSQPLCRQPQTSRALLWMMLMLSAAVRLPGIQDGGRLWGVPHHRLQGVILFRCLGVVQLEETSGSCIRS